MAKSGPRQTLFSIGAFAILFDDQGRVLSCHGRDRDMWNLPGGGVESGELPTEAVVRETKEEVGLDVVVERLVGIYGQPDKDEFVFAFACRVAGGELALTDESEENPYFELDHLPPNMSPRQVARIRDVARRHGQPIVRRQLDPALTDVVHRPPSASGGDGV